MESTSQRCAASGRGSLRLAVARGLYRTIRRRAGPPDLIAGRGRHRRKARRLRAAVGVPGRWSRSRDPAGIRFEPQDSTESDTRVLFLHGGGYVHGSPGSHAAFVARLAGACRQPVLALRYPLAPERPFPAALEHVVAAVSAMARHGPLVLIGESAGGGLALAAAAWCRDHGIEAPAALVCIAPWAELADQGGVFAAWAAAYAPPSRHTDPLVSPVRADARGLPPTHLHVGTADPLLGQAERLLAGLEAAGVAGTLRTWPGGFHGFHHYPLPESAALAGEVGALVQGVVARGAGTPPGVTDPAGRRSPGSGGR